MKTYIDPQLTQDLFASKKVSLQGWFEVFIGDFLKVQILPKGNVDAARGYDARVHVCQKSAASAIP